MTFETVRRALVSSGIGPGSLCLELTESVLMCDVESAVPTLHALKALGVRISVDDFGTGYSSLTYLKQFPLDELKIDKSFVDGLGKDAQDGAIVAAIMGMAHALSLSVVGEGVENQAQLDELRALGCEGGAGLLFLGAEASRRDRGAARRGGARPGVGGGDDGGHFRSAQDILGVDDAPETRLTLRMTLRPGGFLVREAATGEQALVMAGALRPDCVLVDLNVPGGMGGFDVCRALRSDPSTAECTVIEHGSGRGCRHVRPSATDQRCHRGRGARAQRRRSPMLRDH
ncbi:MAG: EAL domain-containing protein [Actinomycetota bacterium]|nr:EAL domain-containing protein [Actinomycetota bacterium]